jgi:hypothetical protein
LSKAFFSSFSQEKLAGLVSQQVSSPSGKPAILSAASLIKISQRGDEGFGVESQCLRLSTQNAVNDHLLFVDSGSSSLGLYFLSCDDVAAWVMEDFGKFCTCFRAERGSLRLSSAACLLAVPAFLVQLACWQF